MQTGKEGETKKEADAGVGDHNGNKSQGKFVWFVHLLHICMRLLDKFGRSFLAQSTYCFQLFDKKISFFFFFSKTCS